MNCMTTILLLAACGSIAHAADYFPAPANIAAEVSSTGVALSWDVVPGAESYVLTLNDGQTTIAPSTHASFGGLMPSTSYSVEIIASDTNNTSGDAGSITFKTLMGRVEGLEVREATYTSLDVMWLAVNDTVRYAVRVTNAEEEEVAADIAFAETSALISGLEKMTFYHVYVRAIGLEQEGEESMIRTRTDGTGVKITAFWDGADGVVGGQGMIFRPIKIPAGVFRTAVQLPCAVQSIRFWNAKLNKDMSRQSEGYYVLEQKKTWMRRKTEIGMNFFIGNSTSCNFADANINAMFGDDVVTRVDTSTSIVCPVQVQEWWTRSGEGLAPPPYAAGWMKFDTNKIFHGANWGDATSNSTIQKPPPGTFTFALNTAPNCLGGIMIRHVWGMSYKDSSSLPGSQPNMHYFTQNDAQWPNALPGFLYSYDPALCGSRDGIELSAMIGGSLVTSIYEEPDADMVH